MMDITDTAAGRNLRTPPHSIYAARDDPQP